MAQFGPPTFSILPHNSGSKHDRIILGFDETPEKVVEVVCPCEIAGFGHLSAQDIKVMLTDRLQIVIDTVVDDAKMNAMTDVMHVLGQLMKNGEIKYLPASTDMLEVDGLSQAEVASWSEAERMEYAKAASFRHWVSTLEDPSLVENEDSEADMEAVAVQDTGDPYNAIRATFKAACMFAPTGPRLAAWLEIKNFIQDVTIHPILGAPLLYAIPHPTSSDPLNPVMSQFLFTYSNVPDRRLCICYGNGLLSKLLADQEFKRHINDHVRRLTKFVENLGEVDMKELQVTEYVLGANGEKSIVVTGKDIMKLSPLVRETVMAQKEHKLSSSKQNKQSQQSVTESNRPESTTHHITNYSLTPSDLNSPYPALITDEIKAILHGKYEQYGDPVFRKVSNLANAGSSQIKLTFTKVPNDQFQLSCDFQFGGGGEGGQRPGSIEEEEILADITRRVKMLLLEKDDKQGSGVDEKVEVRTPAAAPRKRGDLVKKRGFRGPAERDADSIEEIDHELEAVALQDRYWKYSRI